MSESVVHFACHDFSPNGTTHRSGQTLEEATYSLFLGNRTPPRPVSRINEMFKPLRKRC